MDSKAIVKGYKDYSAKMHNAYISERDAVIARHNAYAAETGTTCYCPDCAGRFPNGIVS